MDRGLVREVACAMAKAGAYIIGSVLAVLAGALVALSMVCNRYSLAHAKPHRVKYISFVVRPWMAWAMGMFLYNVGATALASVAQLFVPLTLFACLFITLLVVNLFLARLLLREVLTTAKVAGSLVILAGVGISAAGTPLNSTPLQDEYPCVDQGLCVQDHVTELAEQRGAIALNAALAAITTISVVSMIWMEITYPVADRVRSQSSASHKGTSATAVAPAGAPDTTLDASVELSATATEPSTCLTKVIAKAERTFNFMCCAQGSPLDVPPRLAPVWLERLMLFVYPFSFGVVEGMAHLWLRAEVAMNTQCNIGGCDEPIFAIATACRWTFSASTAFWLVLVFRRYETTVALPIEYGTATAVDVLSGLVFFKEHEEMDAWQLGLVTSGCVLCLIGIAVGVIGEIRLLGQLHMDLVEKKFSEGHLGDLKT